VAYRSHLQISFRKAGLERLGVGLKRRRELEETIMGRGILLWLLGVPIPIIILLALLWH
jgi:hypothetical protein